MHAWDVCTANSSSCNNSGNSPSSYSSSNSRSPYSSNKSRCLNSRSNISKQQQQQTAAANSSSSRITHDVNRQGREMLDVLHDWQHRHIGLNDVPLFKNLLLGKRRSSSACSSSSSSSSENIQKQTDLKLF
ncbi:hypothetical protein ACSSS7_000424 [Eimeria intestinalis]